MRRRRYLALAGAAALPLAGCTDTISGPSTPAATETDTEPTGTTGGGEPEFEVRSVEVPEQITAPEPLPVAVTIANTGGGEGTYEDTIWFDGDEEGTIQQTSNRDIETVVPAGETVTWEEDVEFDGSGYVRLRVSGHEREIIITPDNQAPRIERVALVNEWEEFGDVGEHAVDSVSVDETGLLAVQYRYWHTGGTLAATFEATIYNSDGTQVEVIQHSTERLTDNQGWVQWERALAFRPDTIGSGEYEAEVYVRNDQTDEVSKGVATEFEVE